MKKKYFNFRINKIKIQWCKQIFNDSQVIVINLLTKSFEEFNKYFNKFVEDFMNNSKDTKLVLKYLNSFKQVF